MGTYRNSTLRAFKVAVLSLTLMLLTTYGQTSTTVRLPPSLGTKLGQQMTSDAHDPTFFEECVRKSGGIQKTVDIELVKLSAATGKQYLVSGKANSGCAYGARSPIRWIYELKNGEFSLIADIGACDSVLISSRKRNGYREIRVGSYSLPDGRVNYVTFSYNGSEFKCRDCQ